jgi:putative SOS response-associated peptidase YedK
MCGRFRLGKGREALKKFFVCEGDAGWDPRYNVAPGQNVATIRQDPTQPVRRLALMRWGLIPSWAKEESIGYKMINARSETAADKPAFRDALKSRRCLIPADGFYEWKKLEKSKQPFCFTLADNDMFAFAGIWERWKSPAGQTLETCSILTTSANDLVREVHDRMPVILSPDAYDLWLDPGFSLSQGIKELLQPFSSKDMKKQPVSTRVNSVKIDDAECALATGTQ